MSSRSLDLSVGSLLWHEGSAWTVVEHDRSSVILRSGDQVKRTQTASLVDAAESLDETETQRDDSELDVVVLGALSSKQRAEVERQARVFDELIFDASLTPTNDLYQAAADELGVSLRTAYRRGKKYAAGSSPG